MELDHPTRRRNLIPSEVFFARMLSGNDKKARDRALRKLTNWLCLRSQKRYAFSRNYCFRIWSGLFYTMWMSDKALIQEEVAESISKLIHCFTDNTELALEFMRTFYCIVSVEWTGIDQHRIDKFFLLTRRFLRQTLIYCRKKNWNLNLMIRLVEIYEELVVCERVSRGFTLHFMDIFPEELAKVSDGKISRDVLLLLLEPFIRVAATTKDKRMHRGVISVFDYLIRQSDVGIKYEEKLRAWKELKMPCEKPEDLELDFDDAEEEQNEEEDEDTERETGLDPRAGNVDTILPQIHIDCDALIHMIQSYEDAHGITKFGRRVLKTMENKFMRLKLGLMPESLRKPLILHNQRKKRRHIANCAKGLIEFTKNLDGNCKLDLVLGDVDSDDESPNVKCSASHDESESSDTDNSSSLIVKEGKMKSTIKKKKIKTPISAAGEKTEDKKEMKEMKLTDKTDTSPEASFKVEGVNADSDFSTETPNKKRKLPNTWTIDDLKDDEYIQIIKPKMSIVETIMKGISNEPAENKDASSENSNLEDQNETRQLKLSAPFWDKAKQKALKKKQTSTPNPAPVNQPKISKKISFALERNEAQGNEEYLNEVKNSPSIPFDATRKPVQSALKSGWAPSPINPFFRFKK